MNQLIEWNSENEKIESIFYSENRFQLIVKSSSIEQTNACREYRKLSG